MAGLQRLVGLVARYILALAALGCSAEPAVLVSTTDFPRVAIECRGEAIPPPESCVAWAEVVLDEAEHRIGPPSRLILTSHGDANRRCAADFIGVDGRIFASLATSCPLDSGG